MNVDEIKAQLLAIPDVILRDVVRALTEIEDTFERQYIHFTMLTDGSADPGGDVSEALRLLAEAKTNAADLVGYEDRIRAAIESYAAKL